jgi:hypothetical protein
MLLKTPVGYNVVIHLPLQLNMSSSQSSCLAAVAVPPLTYSVWVQMTSDAMLCTVMRIRCVASLIRATVLACRAALAKQLTCAVSDLVDDSAELEARRMETGCYLAPSLHEEQESMRIKQAYLGLIKQLLETLSEEDVCL